MNYNKKTVTDIDVAGKKVLLRCDFNVPMAKSNDGTILDDKRIREALPTIRYLLEQNAAVIACSHMGKPKGEWKPELSLKVVAQRLSELLGKETIDSFNQSENRGSQVSHGLNYQKLGKELMTQDEIAVMDGGKCILQLRGVRPFFSDKFDITKHPRYKYLADADKKNTFDIERYMKRRPAIVKPDEPFDLYELKATDLQPDNSTERKEL